MQENYSDYEQMLATDPAQEPRLVEGLVCGDYIRISEQRHSQFGGHGVERLVTHRGRAYGVEVRDQQHVLKLLVLRPVSLRRLLHVLTLHQQEIHQRHNQ